HPSFPFIVTGAGPASILGTLATSGWSRRMTALLGRRTATVETSTPASRGMWWRSWRVWLMVAICAILTLISLIETLAPLDRDEGAFLTIAQEILHGRLPYRDAFDHKGPAIYYLVALLLWLTHAASLMTQILVARSVAVLTDLATAAGLVLLGRYWWRTSVG